MLAPLSLYIADTGVTLVQRAARKESLLQAHKTHTYQRLVALGWAHARVAMLCAAVMAVCALLGLASLGESASLRFLADAGIVLLLAGYLVSPKVLKSVRVAQARR